MQQELRRSHDNDHVGSSRVRRKSRRSSEVLQEQIREVQKLAKGARRNLPSGSSQSTSLPEVRRSITEGSSDDRRKFAGNSLEEAIDAPEQVAVNVLGKIVVSTMIKLEMGGDPINLILGQSGP